MCNHETAILLFRHINKNDICLLTFNKIPARIEARMLLCVCVKMIIVICVMP